MKAAGTNALTGTAVEVQFEESICSVADLPDALPYGDCYVAPGWIDIQVNGFAGVDYNNPATSHAAIAHSLDALLPRA